ncbi:MAG: DNA recombination protein RmuC [Bacteroidetes bacterium]|nr:MAG: DNA recombination protein RmuC [Bacteroidota bacterium]
MTEVIAIILGVAVILALILFWLKLNKASGKPGNEELEEIKQQAATLYAEKLAGESKIQMLGEQARYSLQIIKEKEETIVGLNRQVAGLGTENKRLIEDLQTKQAAIEASEEKLRIAFKNLANEILEEKTQKFTEQNRTKLEEILKPLGEKILSFEKKVEEAYHKESNERFSLVNEIKRLAELNQQISQEASNLTQALKGQSKTRGNWGEIILESILEKSGLVKDREYFVQQSYTNAEGKRLQPDVVVVYPGDRSVIIDSKVSLNAYERYASSEIKEEQDTALREHVQAIRNHVNDLSSKNYQDLYQIKSLDFVMMFLPIEPAYMLAMQNDPNLWSFAYDRRILLISPTNLIAALKMIVNLWRVEYTNKNAVEIARQSGELYDKFKGFVDDLEDIGKKINATRGSYDDAMNKLTTGKGNLLRRAEKIRELGAKTSKELPKNLLDKAGENEE